MTSYLSNPRVLGLFHGERQRRLRPTPRSRGITTTTRVEITDEKGARGVLTFVERLEDLDDVQNVYANFDIPDGLMEQLEASVV